MIHKRSGHDVTLFEHLARHRVDAVRLDPRINLVDALRDSHETRRLICRRFRLAFVHE
ncbi:hypothetical protein [Pandoraea sp. E26]|uniref:hypothetical protein n=1 Tax=Pandoraea sp. E26 TaxID=1427365 RepID=UPI001F48C05C|nr:hypothetical protein [Pandoraea sp. E26]